jgi:hypothetical protein
MPQMPSAVLAMASPSTRWGVDDVVQSGRYFPGKTWKPKTVAPWFIVAQRTRLLRGPGTNPSIILPSI